jgi:hypothetical protein
MTIESDANKLLGMSPKAIRSERDSLLTSVNPDFAAELVQAFEIANHRLPPAQPRPIIALAEIELIWLETQGETHDLLTNDCIDSLLPKDQLDPNDPFETYVLREALPAAIELVIDRSNLSERENAVIRYRYGFNDGSPHTVEETAHKFQLTRHRIHQIDAAAIRKLRGVALGSSLSDF